MEAQLKVITKQTKQINKDYKTNIEKYYKTNIEKYYLNLIKGLIDEYLTEEIIINKRLDALRPAPIEIPVKSDDESSDYGVDCLLNSALSHF